MKRCILRYSLWILTIFTSQGFALDEGTALDHFNSYDLWKIINDHSVQTIEALLPLLPLQLRDNPVLMRYSASRQTSDPMNPRAMLFNYDARFIYTIGSEPNDPAADDVEFAEYHEDSGLYQFGRIHFSKQKP